jgi:alanyl-tRNA synthetase
MNSTEIRQSFLDFFKTKGHTIKASASLIPDDASLLFTVAGMVPFKPQFLGTVKLEFTRAASVQKCIRTNDIENVGRTYRHHTFFEMLGNFSFGDYFKEEAIAWAWEYLTGKNWMALSPEKLHISVFRDDEEALGIWKKLGIAPSRIVKLGEASNFWEMGATGPCGPCSEIYYDFGREADPGVKEGDLDHGGNRYVEIWNNVFTQFDKQADGKLLPLPKKNIDTGMGLERLAAVMQGVTSNFDSDLFQPIIRAAAEGLGLRYGADKEKDFSLRVIAEHLRASSFLIADGVMPSNEGRGYVLRRIFRRAVRHGRLLGMRKVFVSQLFPSVLTVMGSAYPELKEREKAITSSLLTEEERFLKTLDQGLGILQEMLAKSKSAGLGHVSGDDAFKLYDTFGFPLELTQEVAHEAGMSVDQKEFENQMEAQRARARAAWTGGAGADESAYGRLATTHGKTKFSGYQSTEGSAKILAILKDAKEVAEASEGDSVELLLDSTPFYGESGGQLGDNGVLEGKGFEVEVLDAVKRAGGELTLHRGRVSQGRLAKGDELAARVDMRRRKAIARHHSATHLLHAALRQVLGETVHQGGSSVGPDRLRFDYAHNRALSEAEKEAVERQVNQWIMSNSSSSIRDMAIQEAKDEGAMALFGEKYGDRVRVVSFGSFSKELCGGTHLAATGEMGFFRILSESSVSAGLRRVEAVAGEAAYEEVRRQQQSLAGLAHALKTSPAELPQRVEKLLEKEKELLKQIDKLKTQGAGVSLDSLLASALDVQGVKLVAAEIPEADDKALKAYGDQLRDRIQSGVIVLGSKGEGKATLVAVVTKDLIARLSAGKLVAALAPILGGKGGGRPDMAQAGGKEEAKLGEALTAAKEALIAQMAP